MLENAIKETFTMVHNNLDDWDSRFIFPMPEVEPIRMKRTLPTPLSPVMLDESSTANNILILENFFRDQFRMTEANEQFTNNLRLIYGDLKTVKRMHSVKHIREATATQSFDTFKWVMPGLGLWHLRYNMLQLIHKVHWGKPSPIDQTTLQYAADHLDRSQVVEPKNFEALEDLILHSYYARVAALIYQDVQSYKLPCDTHEDMKRWILAQSKEQWKDYLEKWHARIHVDPQRLVLEDMLDDVWLNHTRYMRHVESYILLSYAIKYADIGLLRRALREACVMFQSPKGGKYNYARELLRVLHVTDSDAASKELQDAMLINSLVNMRTEGCNHGYTFETDRLLELHNLYLKTWKRDRKSSTQETEDLLRQCALSGVYLHDIKTTLQTRFSSLASGNHPGKNASIDIFSLARSISKGSFPLTSGSRFTGYDAIDLFVDGLSATFNKVAAYNKEVQQGSVWEDDVDISGTQEAHVTVETIIDAALPEDDETGLSLP